MPTHKTSIGENKMNTKTQRICNSLNIQSEGNDLLIYLYRLASKKALAEGIRPYLEPYKCPSDNRTRLSKYVAVTVDFPAYESQNPYLYESHDGVTVKVYMSRHRWQYELQLANES